MDCFKTISIFILSIVTTISLGAQEVFSPENSGLSGDQVMMIQEHFEHFPDHTQLAFAIIDGADVRYFGVIKEDSILYRVDNRDSVFEIGSISKVFTSTLLSHYVEEGELDYSDDIKSLLPQEVGVDDTITLLQLANHTSGMTRMPSNFNAFFADPQNPYKDYDTTKITEYLSEKIKLNNPPGTQYEYSNLGAGLLGYIIQLHTGKNYEELLQDVIFTKLGMSSSTVERGKVQHLLISGRNFEGVKVKNWDFGVLAPAGSILSSVEDLVIFSKLQYDAEDPVYRNMQASTFQVNDQYASCIGWHIIRLESGKELLWHNGATGGYTSSLSLDLENRKGVIILSNVSGLSQGSKEIDRIGWKMINSLDIDK